MNQDSSFPPMLPPSSELGALLFAVLPCLQEAYRPLASFAYHMTELTKLKTIPAVPSFAGLSGIDALITDKDIMLRSLSFYGKMFRMPLLSTIATLLQGMQFYQAYKDILPGLFSGMGTAGDSASSFGGMSGLSPDLFSMLGGMSPDLLSSLFSGFSGGFPPQGNTPFSSSAKTSERSFDESAPPLNNTTSDTVVHEESDSPASDSSVPDTPSIPSGTSENIPTGSSHEEPSAPDVPQETASPSDDLYDTLFSFLTPEQQKIYEQLMHTD